MGIRDLLGEALGAVGKAGALTKNAAESARIGGLEIDEECSPCQVVHTGPAP